MLYIIKRKKDKKYLSKEFNNSNSYRIDDKGVYWDESLENVLILNSNLAYDSFLIRTLNSEKYESIPWLYEFWRG
jgi:hypothetical protein